MARKKIVKIEEIASIADLLRKQGKKIISTNGVFDILHLGHITYLKKAKELGDFLIVGVNSDASVQKLKGPKRPLNNQDARAQCLAALECVDYVVIFNEDDPRRLVESIKPAIHIKGGDYRDKVDKIVEKGVVEKNGGKIALIDMVEGYSTSGLIEKIIKVYAG